MATSLHLLASVGIGTTAPAYKLDVAGDLYDLVSGQSTGILHSGGDATVL